MEDFHLLVDLHRHGARQGPGGEAESLQASWDGAYADIDTAAAEFGVLERNGYTPLGFFILPERSWLDNYYRPLQSRFRAFLERHGHSDDARALLRAEEEEIALNEKYKAWFSYGFHIAKRCV